MTLVSGHLPCALPANPCVVEQCEVVFVLRDDDPLISRRNDQMFIIVSGMHADLRRMSRVVTALPQFMSHTPAQALINVQPRHYRVWFASVRLTRRSKSPSCA